MSTESSPTPELQDPSTQDPERPQIKRKASAAGLDSNGQPRPVKRRASKACQCCRARKVRCNVTEHGAPCTNCRLDEVECIVSESRRKKKWGKELEAQNDADATSKAAATRKIVSQPVAPFVVDASAAATVRSHDYDSSHDEHVPHSIYQNTGQRLNLSLQAINRRLSFSNPPLASPFSLLHHSPISEAGPFFPQRQSVLANLPYYIKPLPPRIGQDEVAYLEKKGALTVPTIPLRNELLKAYIEFVHPYMPLVDLYDFIMIIESGSGVLGRISLILYQAVMFAGSAFVDLKHLHSAGYLTRKEARKDFFQKTRLLYDFDYESDRVSLVQALLLLTYYYETPDDQKDTWHWMGVATSVAHTIGLHRNPEKSTMDAKRTKLWKRIWWSTYMRDRLIALGMRRPTRIKAEDYDVPMLTLDDFDLRPIPDSVSCIPVECKLARSEQLQKEMAIMCIEKAKLCLHISHVLSTQYCVLNNNQGMVNDRTTMMLLPKKGDPETCEVKACDEELQKWYDSLPEEAKQRDFTGESAMDLNRSLLHMVFYTTLSALHRPQVLPSGPAAAPANPMAFDLFECSRRNVRRAATAITSIAQRLDGADLVRYLPTTGVTVLLPAIIIHLLDIKSPEDQTRRESLRGFCQCMQVMGKLRDIYAAADYSTAFLEAAIRKAGIHIAPLAEKATPGDSTPKPHQVTTVEDLVDAGRRLDMTSMPPPTLPASGVTPPPDMKTAILGATANAARLNSTLNAAGPVSDDEVARRLETFLASTPPDSDHTSDPDHDLLTDSASTIVDSTATFPHLSIHHSDKLIFTNGGADSIHHNNNLNTSTSTGHAGFLAQAKLGEDLKLFSSTITGANNANHASNNLLGGSGLAVSMVPDYQQDDFDSLLNMDALGGNDGGENIFSFDDGGCHGFTVDMDWLGSAGTVSGSLL